MGDEDPTVEAIEAADERAHVVIWQDWNETVNNAATAAYEQEYGEDCRKISEVPPTSVAGSSVPPLTTTLHSTDRLQPLC